MTRGVDLCGRRSLRGVVEGIDVGGRAPGERFDLALSEVDPRRSFDRRQGLFEAAPGCLDRCQLAKPVAVALNGEVQHRVLGGEVEVLFPLGTIGEATTVTSPRTVSNGRW